jgi:hypothetical protein
MPGVSQLTAEPSPLNDEDGVREPSGISSSKVSRAPKRSLGWLLGAASLVVVAGAFAFAPRVHTPKLDAARPLLASAPVLPVVSSGAAEPPLSAASELAAKSPPSPAFSAKKAEEPARAHVLSSGSPVPSGSSIPGAEPSLFGLLKITADPRAAVEVSGPHFHQLGQSPMVGLKVPVGRYQVVFRNDTFGAPLSAQIMIVAGVNRSVHADFRQAEPTVSIH